MYSTLPYCNLPICPPMKISPPEFRQVVAKGDILLESAPILLPKKGKHSHGSFVPRLTPSFFLWFALTIIHGEYTHHPFCGATKVHHPWAYYQRLQYWRQLQFTNIKGCCILQGRRNHSGHSGLGCSVALFDPMLFVDVHHIVTCVQLSIAF